MEPAWYQVYIIKKDLLTLFSVLFFIKFRAFSEQLYGTQAFQETLRKHCVDHLLANRSHFEQFIENMSFDNYVNELRKVLSLSLSFSSPLSFSLFRSHRTSLKAKLLGRRNGTTSFISTL